MAAHCLGLPLVWGCRLCLIPTLPFWIGESVPQMKDGITVGGITQPALDTKSEHRVHTLFSGTMLMQHSGTSAAVADAAADADAAGRGRDRRNCASVPDAPDGGCVCYVLATAFSSSQGELMRMIEFSTAQAIHPPVLGHPTPPHPIPSYLIPPHPIPSQSTQPRAGKC